jgi:GT2 family glycosyltransferase
MQNNCGYDESNLFNIETLAKIPYFPGHKDEQASFSMQRARWNTEVCSSAWMQSMPRIIFIVVTQSKTPELELAATLAAIKLQTYSKYSLFVASQTFDCLQLHDGWLRDAEKLEGRRAVYRYLTYLKEEWAIFIQPGDICSPSLGYCLLTEAGNIDQICYWNILKGSLSKDKVNITHRVQTIFCDPFVSNEQDSWRGFAARGLAKEYALQALCIGENPLMFMYDLVEYRKKIHEYLILSTKQTIKNDDEHKAVSLKLLRYCYRTDFKSIDLDGATIPCPASSGKSISIILMFRDKPEDTMRCIDTILQQETEIKCELILIDNQSNKSTRARIEDYCSKISQKLRVQYLFYDQAFNHSAQLKLGVDHANGEILSIVNNDLFLVNPLILDHTARWATCNGVATVGILHRNEQGDLCGGPMKVRMKVNSIYDSPVEEYADIPSRPYLTAGNSFAFAVMQRKYFEMISVDPIRFPNGYNDVDYCIRATKMGFQHITLGYLTAIHLKSISRGKTDETAQRLMLRQSLPGLHFDAEISESDMPLGREIKI